MTTQRYTPDAEWLEVDGLGGFASGTVSGIRNRRYHGLLTVATTPPTGRMVLVNGLEVWVSTPAGHYPISAHRYLPDVVHPNGQERISRFEPEPYPQWTYQLEDGTEIEQEVFVRHGVPVVVVAWRLVRAQAGVKLTARLLVSGRDYHALHHENAEFQPNADLRQAGDSQRVSWKFYQGVPQVEAFTNGRYLHDPWWFRSFLYLTERERGLDHTEDLASPGSVEWDLSSGEACLLLTTEGVGADLLADYRDAAGCAAALRAIERAKREQHRTRSLRTAEAYLVRRAEGRTIVAGYPWFTDWGRDTFIALRGLYLATGHLNDVRQILLAWAETVSQGMLPNRFPDRGEDPEYNAVDASLWFVVVVGEFLREVERRGYFLQDVDRARLHHSVTEILTGYTRGTRFRIHQDDDGLLAAGEPGVALTWMDARVQGHPVTPRVGKPVEVQALWINALRTGAQIDPVWQKPADLAATAFFQRFWNADGGFLYDVVDVDHVAGMVDPTCRPNQILAVGGLPFPVLEGERARGVVDVVESRLWTPLGLRTLAPDDPRYISQYRGSEDERAAAYHQGPAWPWLLGPFAEAWVAVQGASATVRAEARRRFLGPLLRHLDEAGLGHVSEITDAEVPFTPGGCPFQAWSLGELLRLQHVVLSEHSLPRER